jgi:hypothetical protein
MKRILHVGVGPLGVKILNELYERHLGHVVAVVDMSPSLAGQPLTKIVPAADPKIRILPNLAAVDNWDQIDAAIVSTSSDLKSCEHTFRDIPSATSCGTARPWSAPAKSSCTPGCGTWPWRRNWRNCARRPADGCWARA